jgi:hypothetical protein
MLIADRRDLSYFSHEADDMAGDIRAARPITKILLEDVFMAVVGLEAGLQNHLRHRQVPLVVSLAGQAVTASHLLNSWQEAHQPFRPVFRPEYGFGGLKSRQGGDTK